MEDIFLYLRWEEHWPWCSGGAQPQAGTRTVERTGGIFQPRFIMRLKCHFFLFPSKVMAGSSTAAAGLPGGLRLGCRRQGWHQNPLHDCRWYVSKLFVSCMANLAWRIGVMIVASLATSSPVYNLFVHIIYNWNTEHIIDCILTVSHVQENVCPQPPAPSSSSHQPRAPATDTEAADSEAEET